MNDSDLDRLRELARRQRVYAPMREGGTKEQKELAVVTDWLETMTRDGNDLYTGPRTADKDPPDCLVQTKAGALVGVEVAELVCQVAIELNEQARPGRGQRPSLENMVHGQWTRSSFINAVADRIEDKDRKAYLGGPFAELILLLHTDEPLLVSEQCDEWLRGYTFPKCAQLTSGYFVHAYRPMVGYPVTQLRLGGA